MQFITTPDYPHLEWLRAQDRRPSQRYLRRMLQYLQWQAGGKQDRPYVLKNPGNTGEFLEMLDVFPRATFVISRRDLCRTMGSSMRMGTEILVNTFDSPDPAFVGQYTVDYWAYELHRYLDQRAQRGAEVRLIEVDYERCVADGLSVAREVYAVHGLPWTPAGEAAMRQWDAENPRHKLGAYGYALEDYGWSAERIAEALGPVAAEWEGK
jgi:hypothetical protein